MYLNTNIPEGFKYNYKYFLFSGYITMQVKEKKSYIKTSSA